MIVLSLIKKLIELNTTPYKVQLKTERLSIQTSSSRSLSQFSILFYLSFQTQTMSLFDSRAPSRHSLPVGASWFMFPQTVTHTLPS